MRHSAMLVASPPPPRVQVLGMVQLPDGDESEMQSRRGADDASTSADAVGNKCVAEGRGRHFVFRRCLSVLLLVVLCCRDEK